jgi:hypothetical protein
MADRAISGIVAETDPRATSVWCRVTLQRSVGSLDEWRLDTFGTCPARVAVVLAVIEAGRILGPYPVDGGFRG